MKTSITWYHNPMPSLFVEGRQVGRVKSIDLDLKEDGTIAIDKLHISPDSQRICEPEYPKVPDHPGIVIKQMPTWITGAEAIEELARVGPTCPEEGQVLLERLTSALVEAQSRIAYLEGRLGVEAGPWVFGRRLPPPGLMDVPENPTIHPAPGLRGFLVKMLTWPRNSPPKDTP